MRSFLFTALLATLALIPTAARSQTDRQHHVTLNGLEVSRGGRGVVTLTGRAAGDLRGSFEVTLRYDSVTKAVTGGTWKIVEAAGGGQAASKTGGALSGTLKGGAVRVGAKGKVESLEGVRLTVSRGEGTYREVKSGTGELGGTLNLRRQHPFAGKVRLDL